MAQEIIMPKLGLTMTSGTVTRWLKKEGDRVKAGEAVVEIETDKISAEVESPFDGTILKILAQEGEEREITVPICIIGEAGEIVGEGQTKKPSIEAPVLSEKIETVSVYKPAARIFITPIARKVAKENNLDYSTLKGSGPLGRIVKADILKLLKDAGEIVETVESGSSRIRITPLARKIAEDNGIDVSKVKGTGPEGRIVKEDILAAIESKQVEKTKVEAVPSAQQTETASGARRVPLSGMRKVIAQRLTQSKRDIPHVYFKASIDMTQALVLKNKASELIKAKTGRKLSINDIVLKATAAALTEFPGINASLIDNEIIYHDHVNLGMAVSVEKGLVVPVIKDADKLSLSRINQTASEMAEKARDGKLALDEMSGGTFTVSNLGAYGIDEFSAIINPPESAILAVGRVAETPVAENGQVVIKPMMALTLSVDHRIIDGALAAQFMKRLKELFEDPFLLLI